MINQENSQKNFNVGDILVSDWINKPENIPHIFKTHKVDNDFGVVYYKHNGKEETIGFSYVRKATFLERIFGWLLN